jgi:Cu-Zn family superoxide dismutase
MRARTRTRAVGAGIALAIGGLVAAPASAGANVAIGSGPFTANPAFVANELDAVNPAIGATGRVHLVVNGGKDGQTLVTLHVEGLPSGRSFGAHLHRDSCSSAFGGPHYQAPDPATPVAANADADHEVWLDFTTNATGRGRSQAVVPFEVLSASRSVVIHQNDHTAVGGTAGPRLACLDLTI